MDIHLRLILFLVGSIILALVVWEVLRQKKLNKQQQEFMLDDQFYEQNEYNEHDYESRQQSLDFGEVSEITSEVRITSAISVPNPQPVAAKTEQPSVAKTKKSYSINDMFALFVMARDPKGFNGGVLKQILESANLNYGKMNIFHRYDDENEGEILFSVASAVEPGFFDVKSIDIQHIPGITIFMVFSKVADPLKAFDALVRTARQLAFSLNGELRDKYRNPLTLQTIDSYKSNLKSYAPVT